MRLLSYFLLLGCLTLFTSDLSASTFVGGYEGNIWTDYRNWDDQHVPGAGDEAVIPQDRGVTINGAITVGSLILNGGLNNDGNPNSNLTVVASFSWSSGSIGVPVILQLGCSGLFQGGLGLGANLTNYGEISCNADITLSNCTIFNYGEFDLAGEHAFGVYYSPTIFENHGLLKKSIIDPTSYNFFVRFINHPDGNVLVENGEINASQCEQYGNVSTLAGGTFRTHGLEIYNGATFTGAGRLYITGNGAYAKNSNPVTVDMAEVELNANIVDAGELIFTQHMTFIGGGLQCLVTFATGSVVDVNPGGNPGLTNIITNNGTFNFNANFTFSYGHMVNNGTIHFNGANTIGIYAGSPGFYNHGTAIPQASSTGTFLLNLPFHNESDGQLLVQKDELHCAGGLDNSGDIVVAANSTLRVNDTHIYDGATLTGEGTYIDQGNGVFAHNTNPVSIDIAETNIISNINGTGPLTFTGHINWSSGALGTPVTFAPTCIVDVNGGVGITTTATNNGTINVNSGMTFSYGGLINNGLMLLNGPYNIGIYAGSSGIENHGIIKKPFSSGSSVYYMGVPLNNETDGNVIVESGELNNNGGTYNHGSILVQAGAVFRASQNLQVFDGASISGEGKLMIEGNGLYAANTTDVTFSIATVEAQSSASGTGLIIYSGTFKWLAGYQNAPWTISSTGVLDVVGGYGISGTLTVNGVMNVEQPFFCNGTINNNGTINLNIPGQIGGYGLLNNTGTILKHVSAADVQLTMQVYNSGTIQALSDNLSFQGGLVNSGIIEVSANANAQTEGYGNFSFEAGSSITGAGKFTCSSNMAVNADLTIEVAQFDLFQGSLSEMGTLTFPHIFNANGYLQCPVIVATGGTMNANGAALYDTLTNNGTINNNADFFIDFNALIQNNGAFHLLVDGTLGGQYNYYASGQFNNAGTLDKVSAGTSALNVNFTNPTGGLIDVQNGILEIYNLDNSGHASIAEGAKLTVKGGNNLAGGTLSGDGAIRIEGNGWNLANPLTLNSLDLEIAGNLTADPGATLEIQGLASWISGDIAAPINIASGGTFQVVEGYATKTLSAPITNAGTFNLPTYFSANADINNSGNFNFTGDSGGFYGASTATFTNTGTVLQNTPYSSTIGIKAINNGTISIQSASLYFYNGLENNAVVIINAGSVQSLSGVSSFNAGSSVTGAGSIEVGDELTLGANFSFSGELFTLYGDLVGPGNLDINSAMVWANGHIQTDVNIASGATLEIGSSGGGNSSKTMAGGSKSGKFNAASKAAAAAQLTAVTNAVANPNAGLMLFSTFGQVLSANITNNGTTNQHSNYDMDGGSFLNNGQLNNTYGGINDGGNGGTLTNNGNWTIDNSFFAYINASNNGTLNGNGYLTFEPEWENNGMVSPGLSIGQFTFQHNYQNGSELDIEVASSDGPGIGHDYIEAQENITLGGALVVTETGSPLNAEYVILHCNGGSGCLTGTFSSTSLPSDYTVSYTGESVILTKGQPATVSPADTSICSGNLVTLTASAGESYQWSTGETTQSIDVYPSYNSSYSVTVFDSNGGGSLGGATVNVNPSPYAYVYPGYTVVCQGESATLTIYGDEATYLWSTGETTQSITVNPTTEVVYYATVTAPGGCTTVVNATVAGSENPASTPEITDAPTSVCESEYYIYLNTYQDVYYGEWTGNGVYYGYLFVPTGLSGTQTLTFTPYPGQCATATTWALEVTPGIFYEDADGDGYGNPAVSQTTCSQPSGYVADHSDCDDTNAAVHPGATEIVNGIDDDCNGLVDENNLSTFYADTDGDGFGDPNNSIQAAEAPAGYVTDNTDCNDANAAVNPGATETCNGIDDDCDGLIDEGVQSTFYADADGDGFGNATVSTMACSAPEGYVSDNTDCDDANAAVHPGATETCNGIDDDCDGLIDEGVQSTFYADADGDGFGNATVSTMACSAPEGYVSDNTDCDDANAAVNPGATETCNGIDDDCDGLIDEGVQSTFYADADGDGFGDATVSTMACSAPEGYVSDNTDCNDANAAVNPGATETCNGIDDDCDGLIDEGVQSTFYADADGDGFGNATVSTMACSAPEGYVSDNTDCNDANAAVHPGATEICNNMDDDCDGLVDETTLNVNLSVGTILCNGGSTTLVASGSGGVGPYLFSLDSGPFVSSNMFTVTVGSHFVTVKDASTCIATNTIDVSEPPAITIDPIEVTHVACGGGNTGAVNISVSGGSGAYTYHWSNNKTTEDLVNLAGNTYTVTVTASGACTATASATVNPKLKLTLSKTNVVCNGGSDGTATATATAGTPGYSYEWNTGASTATITGLAAGTYSVTITDALDCTRTGHISVGQPSAVGISGVVTKASCNGSATGSIAVTISNGVAPFTYAWSDGATTEDRTDLVAGTYTLLVTDNNGCTREKSFTITQPTSLSLSFGISNVSCNGTPDGEITANVSGGTKFPTTGLCNGERYCFSWSHGDNARITSGLVAGTYTVTVTDANGCSIIGSATVTEPAVVQITQVQVDPLANGKFKITVSAAGGTTPYKYKRIPGGGFQTSNVFNNVPAGTYTIVVRDNNICEATTTITVGAGNKPGDADERKNFDELLIVDLSNPVLVFPNPATELFHLQVAQEFKTARVTIFNGQGQLMTTRDLEENADLGAYEVNTWEDGLYLVVVELDGERFVQKLMVTGK